MHQNVIIQSLKQERVIKNDNDVQFSHIATPQFMGCDAWAYAVDLDNLNIQLKNLHKQDVLARISANLGGIKVSYANTQGFAFIIKNERVASLEPVDLLEVCQEPDDAGRLHDIWIYGVKGSGKTSLIQHIVQSDIEAGRRVHVSDPKPNIENDWSGAKTYGNGYKYNEIDDCITEMDRVLTEYGKTGIEVPYTFIFDEWFTINGRIPDAAKRVISTVTIARTAGIRVILGTHSERVKAAGVEGEGDLMLNFNIKVLLAKGFKTKVDYGGGEIPAKHPGPFITSTPTIIDVQPTDKLTDSERLLIRLSYERNKGSFAVTSLNNATSNEFTHHQIRTILADFERRGLLVKEGNRRRPTQKMRALLPRCLK